MQLDPRDNREAVYKLLIGCVVPRPIAWVSTLDANGVNVVDDALAEAMNLTSGEYPAEVDEFALANLTAAPGVVVRAPRVAEAPISLECRVAQIIEVGRGPHQLVIGEIVYFHIRDDVYDPATGRVDMHRLRPLGRLAGHMYAHVHDIFEMKRPVDRYGG